MSPFYPYEIMYGCLISLYFTGDVPGAPLAPRVEAVDERVLRAWWAEPLDNGYPITRYRVWGTPRHRLDGEQVICHSLPISKTRNK